MNNKILPTNFHNFHRTLQFKNEKDTAEHGAGYHTVVSRERVVDVF